MLRNLRVTVLTLWVFILGASQWVRAGVWFSRQPFLNEFALTIPAWYVILSAVGWGGVLVLAALGIWRTREWARYLALAGVTISQSQEWIDRLIFRRSDYTQQAAGFALILTALLLLVSWLLLWKKF